MSILDKRIQLTVGVRRQQVASASFDRTTGAQTSSYDEYAWSPAYALVVKPWENVSLYANYIEGLEPGTIVGNTYANVGQIFPPYQTKQYETGVKVDWGTVTTTVSAFQIVRPSTITIPGTPLPTLALDGEQVNRGIEFNVFGEVTPGLRLLGGVTFLDARLTKTANGANDGNRAVGVPDMNFVLGGEWDTQFLPGFTLTGRINHSADTFYDAANTRTVPAWTRVDLGARYTFDAPWNKKPVTIRFIVENVLGNNYWLNYNGQLFLADPRTYRLSTTFNF
jgi:iron complex outermembrane receptor protein